jgi:hypothetical protein
MLSDDVYKTRFRATIASLESWLDSLGEVAAIEISNDEATWRVAVKPFAVEACPFELVLRIDQCFDLAVGAETFEDQPVQSLDLLQPLLNAVASGRVVTRTWSTAATGTTVRVETIVGMPDEAQWTRTRQMTRHNNVEPDNLIKIDRHYTPYARGA